MRYIRNKNAKPRPVRPIPTLWGFNEVGMYFPVWEVVGYDTFTRSMAARTKFRMYMNRNTDGEGMMFVVDGKGELVPWEQYLTAPKPEYDRLDPKMFCPIFTYEKMSREEIALCQLMPCLTRLHLNFAFQIRRHYGVSILNQMLLRPELSITGSGAYIARPAELPFGYPGDDVFYDTAIRTDLIELGLVYPDRHRCSEPIRQSGKCIGVWCEDMLGLFPELASTCQGESNLPLIADGGIWPMDPLSSVPVIGMGSNPLVNLSNPDLMDHVVKAVIVGNHREGSSDTRLDRLLITDPDLLRQLSVDLLPDDRDPGEE